MKTHKKARRIIAVTMAVLLVACSFIETGTGYVYATETDYSVEESSDSSVTETVLDFDAGGTEETTADATTAGDAASETTEPDALTATEPEIIPEEIPSTESAEPDAEETRPQFSGRFVYVDETGDIPADTITGEELNPDGTIDHLIHANAVQFSNGTTYNQVPVVNPDGSIAGKGPAVMWAYFDVNGTERALSLFCVDHGANANTNDVFTIYGEETYGKLCPAQKAAISYVLGSSHAMKQAPDSGQGFNQNIDFNQWQVYYATQLMIWYYIQEKNNGTSSNHGITWEQVVATCNAGYGSLQQCQLIKEEVDSFYEVPSFAKNKALGNSVPTPTYELKYDKATGTYSTTLTNTNAKCNMTYFFGATGNTSTETLNGTVVSYTRTGENTVKVSTTEPIGSSGSSAKVQASRQFMPNMGEVTYIKNQTTNANDNSEKQDFLECISDKRGRLQYAGCGIADLYIQLKR